MINLPESYFVYKEHLHKAQEERKKLKLAYEMKICEMKKEIDYLKEQIESQHLMIRNTVEYAIKLENEINVFRKDLNQKEH